MSTTPTDVVRPSGEQFADLAFGDSDPVFFEQGEAWAAEIPGATLDRIPSAGHFVQHDAPDDCLAVIGRRVELPL